MTDLSALNKGYFFPAKNFDAVDFPEAIEPVIPILIICYQVYYFFVNFWFYSMPNFKRQLRLINEH